MAALIVELLDAAMEEARAARIWYAQRSATASANFMIELDQAIAEITQHPQRWPTHLYHTRRYRMHKFPFLIVHQIQLDRIQVIACQHGRRRPGYWRSRIDR